MDEQMKSLEDIYREAFFRRRKSHLWRVPWVCAAVMEALNPTSLVDVGCGIGDFVQGFIDRGVTAYGIEGSTCARPYLVCPQEKVFFKDLRVKFSFPRMDVCLCLEVVEHIEKEYEDNLVDNLCGMSDVLVLSIAPPGQKGHYHVNLQTEEYWDKKFSKRKYFRDPKIEAKIRRVLVPVKDHKTMSSYFYNLRCYRKVVDG